MSITYKVLLDTRYQSTKGVYPLKVRLFQNSNSKEYSIGIKVPETEWDREAELVIQNSPRAVISNTKIQAVKNKVQKLILLSDLEEETNLSLDEIIAELNGTKSKKQPK